MKFFHHIHNFLLKLFVKTTVGVKIFVIQNGKVLLVKHTYVPGWHLPGGGVDTGESPETAALRELQEETGIVPRTPLQLFGFYYHFISGRHDYVGLYILHDFEKISVTCPEIKEIQWFPMDLLPHDISPGTQNRIREYLGYQPISDKW